MACHPIALCLGRARVQTFFSITLVVHFFLNPPSPERFIFFLSFFLFFFSPRRGGGGCCNPLFIISTEYHTGCPKINFTILNVNNIRTNIRIATPAIYIDRGHLQNYFGTKHDAFSHFKIKLQCKLRQT